MPVPSRFQRVHQVGCLKRWSGSCSDTLWSLQNGNAKVKYAGQRVKECFSECQRQCPYVMSFVFILSKMHKGKFLAIPRQQITSKTFKNTNDTFSHYKKNTSLKSFQWCKSPKLGGAKPCQALAFSKSRSYTGIRWYQSTGILPHR